PGNSLASAAPTSTAPGSPPAPSHSSTYQADDRRRDEERLTLAHGLRPFVNRNWNRAKIELQQIGNNRLAQNVLSEIQNQEAKSRNQQAGAVLKALAQDVSDPKYARALLLDTIDKIQAQPLPDGEKNLAAAILKMEEKLPPSALELWRQFRKEQQK